MPKFVLYGGKGGVGKTTCAAATALELAARGERTLLVSTDPAHSLGDAFDVPLTGEPTAIDDDLWGVEADPEQGQAAYQGIVSSLAADFRDAGISMTDEDVERLFQAGFVPGSDEIASLQFFLDYADDEWDRVVFDTAPTGHTLRLLTLPDVLSESLSTATKVRGEVRRLVDTARSMVVGPAAFWGNDSGEDEIQAFRGRMERVAALLRDPERTDFRVVLLPETLAIEETRRLVDRLESYDVPVETLLVNRVLETADEDCSRCRDRHESHQRQLDRIHETFPEREIQVLPDLGPEAYGRDALERLADRIEI
ncbi:arsenite efflux ATP-binding protein ArsA [Halorientalis persicus]|jgi:arsenite-transporting ATPase|uniref:Arsenite efflux ATP-binding protein ArsA n=1 Tax=Halorientalis persicus TaxID=1367881 RepID=A0A1H8UMZ1_9EURY|nr:ArsA family ATPase [Halorientalis persicus]SEP04521.1 arsenite efflux ATP-binding protein ArsA [Halorientalis persicus]